MKLDEFEILLTEAYLNDDQVALDDLKLQAQIKLHTEGDRTLWERWEHHRMLESMIQDWPEPLLRRDLTDDIMLALEVNSLKPITKSSTLSDCELELLQVRETSSSAIVKKPKTKKLDSFTITPPNQQHQFRRYISRIGYTFAVFMVGITLGLGIYHTIDGLYHGSSHLADKSNPGILEAGMNGQNIDLSRAISRAGQASNVILNEAVNNTQEGTMVISGMNGNKDKPGILSQLFKPAETKPQPEIEKTIKKKIDDFWNPKAAPPGSDAEAGQLIPVAMIEQR